MERPEQGLQGRDGRRTDVIITCTDAREAGSKRYFTGVACKHGHTAERYVSNSICVVCMRDIVKAKTKAKAANKNKVFTAKVRRNGYMRRYKVSIEEINQRVLAQGGKCLICGEPRPLVLDHCHASKIVRGLLCSPCNRHLGLYEKWKTEGNFDRYLGAFQ